MTSGVPVWMRPLPLTLHPPTRPCTVRERLARNRRSRPNGRSHKNVVARLCVTSNVDTDQSSGSGAPSETWPFVRTGLKSVNLTPPLSDASSMPLP